MKMFSSDSLRAAARLVNGALLLGGLTALSVGCGSDSSNPTAISIDELKAPGNLSIRDNGNGSATLSWTGSNNESDFDGYNVYGLNKAKIDGFGTTYKEGQAIELLDEKGEPVDAARTFLGQFNYNPDKPLEETGTGTSDDAEAKFSALPIYKKGADGKGIFPTCGVNGATCKNHDASFPRQTVKNDSARGANGQLSYEISGLTVGQTYCFFVLSSMDEGAKVSMTSTNIACVTPRYKSEFSITIPADKSEPYSDAIQFNLHSFLKACQGSTGCAAGDSASVATVNMPKGADGTSVGPMYVENFQDGVFTPGKNVGVRDLGFYAEGFNDPTLPSSAPALVLDTTDGKDSKAPIINGGGYTPAGRSRKIEKNHVYVFAVPAEDDTSDRPTSFFYHYVWVKGDVVAGQATQVEMRVSTVINQR